MKAAGQPAALYYDGGAAVDEGDYIRVTRTGRTYLVIGVRLQERGKWAGRQHLATVVMEPDHDTGDATVHPLAWYARGTNRTPPAGR